MTSKSTVASLGRSLALGESTRRASDSHPALTFHGFTILYFRLCVPYQIGQQPLLDTA